MPCFHPLKGYRSRFPGKSGKRPIVFNVNDGYADLPVTVPCGQCIGCRLERSRQWAMRCVHEASLYEQNCFVTLTFSPEHLPADGSLNHRHFQLFMKNLKTRVRRSSGKAAAAGIRFYMCGEYGELHGRPHYHALLFNYDFPDKELFTTRNGIPLYRSAFLEELWKYGYSSIGAVTFESAAYVARYILKKVTGDEAAAHYGGRRPEYTNMSRRPGIARAWFEQFRDDVYPSDVVVLRGGMKLRPPRYYDGLFEAEFPSDFKKLKARRKSRAAEFVDNNTPSRLKVRERVQKAKLALLKRSLE